MGGPLRSQGDEVRVQGDEVRVQGKSAPAEGTAQSKALWQDQLHLYEEEAVVRFCRILGAMADFCILFSLE